MVHTAFGVAVAAAEVLLRPEAVGLDRSAGADAALAILTGLILVAYDFLIYPSDLRPGPVGTALPMAAVLSFGTLLAIAVLPLPIRVGGGVIAAVVIGGVPQLAGRRALGKEGWFTRLIRDVSGIAVLALVMLGGARRPSPVRLRLAAVFAVAVLVSVDGLRTERLSSRGPSFRRSWSGASCSAGQRSWASTTHRSGFAPRSCWCSGTAPAVSPAPRSVR